MKKGIPFRVPKDAAKLLAEDLLRNRDSEKWVSWKEVPLGSVWGSNGTIPRADVISISKNYHPSVLIYEIKVSRGDFLSDINSGKFMKYFDYCSQFYFAMPKGLVKTIEIPDSCGLITKGPKGWHVAKAAPRRDFTPGSELLLKLLMRGYEQQREQWNQYEKLKNLEYKGLKEASYEFGIKVGRELADAENLVKLAEKLKGDIGYVMGKDYGDLSNAAWAIQHDIQRLLGRRKFAMETLRLIHLVEKLTDGYDTGNVARELRTLAGIIEKKEVKEDG